MQPKEVDAPRSTSNVSASSASTAWTDGEHPPSKLERESGTYRVDYQVGCGCVGRPRVVALCACAQGVGGPAPRLARPGAQVLQLGPARPEHTAEATAAAELCAAVLPR